LSIDLAKGTIARDLAFGRTDVEFFAERWLGIKGNPGQVAWWTACAERDASGWRPKYLTTVVSAGNRAGKTLAMAVVCLHHAFYKLGSKPPEQAGTTYLSPLLQLAVTFIVGASVVCILVAASESLRVLLDIRNSLVRSGRR
jgi:hypothetical protein